MWVVMKNHCVPCTVVAGDFADNGLLGPSSSPQYLDLYVQALHGRHPYVWGEHPYLDTSAYQWAVLNGEQVIPLDDTLTGKLAAELSRLGFHGNTRIWINEISVFTVDMFHNSQHYSRASQAQAMRYLLTELTRAGGRTHPGEPVVTRLYYLRFADAQGWGRWALVVGGKREPLYRVLAHRPEPQR
jgi:hypothetical protein